MSRDAPSVAYNDAICDYVICTEPLDITDEMLYNVEQGPDGHPYRYIITKIVSRTITGVGRIAAPAFQTGAIWITLRTDGLEKNSAIYDRDVFLGHMYASVQDKVKEVVWRERMRRKWK